MNYKFCKDSRSLSLFRVVLGLNIIYNIIFYRLSSVSLFYGKSGIVSQEELELRYGLFSVLHYLPNGGIFFYFLMVLVVAVLFTIGYKTKWLSILLFFMFSQVLTGNPMTVHAVEFIIEVCLFWSIFLPLQTHFSPFKQKEIKPVSKLAVFAMLLQIFLLYFTSVVTKTGELWQSGLVIESASGDLTHAALLSGFFGSLPGLSKILTYSALVVELLIAMLVWGRGKLRMLAVILIIGLHVGIALAIDVGPFYFSTLCFAVFLLPTSFWERTKVPTGPKLKFNDRINWKSPINIFLILCMLLMVQKNMNKWQKNSYLKPIFDLPGLAQLSGLELNRPGMFTGIWDQPWWLFAPDPHKDMGTVLIGAQLPNGQFVDLMTGDPFQYQKLPDGQVKFDPVIYNNFTHSEFVFSWYVKRNHNTIPQATYNKWLKHIKKKQSKKLNLRVNQAMMFYYSNKTTVNNGQLVREKRMYQLAQG